MGEDKPKMGRKVGLYLTISFHLVLLIILLIFSIHTLVEKETSFVLDFSKQEEIEKEQQVQKLKEDVSKELDELLATSSRRQIRNVAVDASAPLKDDRSERPNEVYEQAQELQRRLDAAKKEALAQETKEEETVDLEQDKKPEKKSNSNYNGPSVISYKLDGRKARYLPVPAYKGYGSGDVLVEIIVNNKGRVVKARVLESVSTSDRSLHDHAIEAAMRSRFNASTTQESQIGSILYRFIGQ